MNKQILALCVILIFALAISGYSYSLWQETINIQGTSNIAEVSIFIDDYNNTKANLSTDKHTLEITDTITQGQTNWTGIIIKNNGTAPPTSITCVITTSSDSLWQAYFTHNEYFYGPYTPDPPAEVWNSASTLPPLGGSSSPPPEFPAENKLVVWQSITLSGTPTDAFIIGITVAYTATYSSWTDTVYVKYILTFQP
jgi:hypothetical protein